MTDISIHHFVNIFRSFPLHVFDPEGLRSLWINGFSDVDDLVRDYFSSLKDCDCFKDLPGVIKEACSVTEELFDRLSKTSTQDTGSGETFGQESTYYEPSTTESLNQTSGSDPWSALSKQNINQQSVLAFLFVFLQSECSSDISEFDKHLSLLSARLYLNLLCLPGRNAFGIFHDIIFQNSINCMKTIGTQQDDAIEKQNNPGLGKKKKQGRGKAQAKQKTATRSNFSDSDEEIEEHSESQHIHSPKRKNSNIPVNAQNDLIQDILISLENVLKCVPLRQHTGMVIEKLVEISMWETEFVPPIPNLFNDTESGLKKRKTNVSSLSFRNLVVLCNPIHGDLHNTFCTVFFYLLPSIIMNSAGNSQNIPRNIALIKEKSTELVVYMLQKYSPDILPAARILLQHVSTKLADRAEFRAKVCQSVISFLQHFPAQEKASIIKWFLTLSKNTKAGHRMFSLEVLCYLLKGQELLPEDSSLISLSSVLKAVVDRIDDKSAAVSSKAMALLSSDTKLLKRILDQSADIDQTALFDVITESCSYEKSAVRKAGILLLESFICQSDICLTEGNLKQISSHAQDINVSVQKQASVSINKVLETYPTSDLAQDAWLETLLPLVHADETSVQEKGLEIIEATIIQPLTQDNELSWVLLSKISDGGHQDKQAGLRRAFSIWLRTSNGKPKSFLKSIVKKMDTHYRQAAWMVLTLLTLGKNPPYLDFLVDSCLVEMTQEGQDPQVLKRILQVVSQTSQCIPKNDLNILLTQLESCVKEFRFLVQVLPSAFQAIADILYSISGDSSDKRKEDLCISVCQEIDQVFSTSVLLEQGFKPDTSTSEEEKLVRCIFTVGEVFQLRPWLLPQKFKLVIHSLLGRPIVSTDMLSPDTFPFNTPPQAGSVSVKIKAHAIISWGKICIGDLDYCKNSILTAIKELQESTEPSIRNNLAVVLSDFIIFHPNLIEPYIATVTTCLRDKSKLVRRQTLSVFAKLLKEDYVKWKGSLFYRVLLCCVDESRDIASMAEYCLLQLLLKRQPHAFSQHFVECIYYLNSYNQNGQFNQFPGELNNNTEQFSLKDTPEKRSTLYQFLLRNMPDQERFFLHHQICQDILSPLLDGTFPLDKESSSVIKDALCVLSCEDIKVTPLAGFHEDEDDEDSVLRADAKKAITTALRKEAIKSVLPTVVSLKTFLEKAQSPIIRELEIFLKEFLKDFKNELKDILGEDTQLAAEINFIVNSVSRLEAAAE